MVRLSNFFFHCVLALVLQSVATVERLSQDENIDSDYEFVPNSCWTTDECLIAANLQFLSGNILPITVNCSTAEKFIDETTNVAAKRRYENISTVTLDGCGVALNANTFGFEYIPNCEKINSLNLKNFHFDEIYDIICGTNNALENVRFEHNEFARVTSGSTANLNYIKTLHFFDNNIRHIDADAFGGLQRLREIKLIKENNLRIRHGKMFKDLLRLEKLHLSEVNKVTSDLLLNLPVNVEEVFIDKTSFEGIEFIVTAPLTLSNLSITNCALTCITINGQETLLQLNLSGNLLNDFSLHNCTHLQLLDLSSNNLTHLQHLQFDKFHHLDYIYLQRNKLKTLSMLVFGNSLTHMNSIDLRDNDLKHIDDISDQLELSTHLRILIDRNPWNCIWLVNVSYRMPEQYRIFRYEKFISKINVNGLECMTYPADIGPQDLTGALPSKNSSAPFTVVHGPPRESKRNQKAEALVIVFMLPLGIALLFVLLYLWINCQKVFHLSYYRNLPLVRGSAERFDVVRQLPHNNTVLTNNPNQGYEIPLTGCNCTDHESKICNKVNLTYEEMPQTNAEKIYEEILEHSITTPNCCYDHLRFEEHNKES